MSSWLTLAARWYLATKRNRFYGHCWCWWRFFNVQFTLLTIGPFDNRLSTTMFLCSQNYTDNTINIRTINVYTDAHKYLTGPNNLQNIYIYMYNMIGCTIGGRRCHSLNALLIRFGKNKGNTRLVQRRVSGSDAQWLGVWRSGPPCANSQWKRTKSNPSTSRTPGQSSAETMQNPWQNYKYGFIHQPTLSFPSKCGVECVQKPECNPIPIIWNTPHKPWFSKKSCVQTHKSAYLKPRRCCWTHDFHYSWP